MKKLLTFCIIILLSISSICITASAKEVSGWYSTITVNNKEENIIKNKYYQIYYNNLFESTYNTYKNHVTAYTKAKEKPEITIPNVISESILIINKTNVFFNSDSVEKIGHTLYQNIKNSDDTYYIMLIFSYNSNAYKENNQKILSSIDELKEILYVGDTTPCAIVSIVGKNINEILKNESIIFVNYPFSAIEYIPSSKIPEKGDRVFSPTAADARLILRYSANIFTWSDMASRSEIKEFLILSDTNLDGEITAADARTALRISAKLESEIKYSVSSETFWNF